MSDELNHLRRLPYHEPATILRKLRKLGEDLRNEEMDDRVRRLRTPGLKKYREGRDAALFTYGMGLGKEVPMYYALFESSDFDFVTRWTEGTTDHYCPVQLKELVPADLNANATIEELLAKQTTARPPTQTVLAIKLNRRGISDLSQITIPPVPFKQVWFFWASAPDGSRWTIYGDALNNPEYFAFEYPP